MRALEPSASGLATNPEDGVRLAWEAFGPPDAPRTLLCLPTWLLVHSRVWKGQVPYFAQHGFRVVTYDPRGNGRSDRPATGYQAERLVADALAVCRAAGIARAALLTLSAGAHIGTQLAVDHPALVTHLVYVAPGIRFGARPAHMAGFHAAPPDREGWHKYNAVHWREDYRDFLAWFLPLVFSEPHSTKAVEDATAWALETTPEILITHADEARWLDTPALAARVACPALVLHGEQDTIVPLEHALQLHATLPDSRLAIIEGGGHSPTGRHPVRANELIHDFLGRAQPREQRWPRAQARPRRALFVSSPIGLGHVQRDLAIARELRALVPNLELDWLAQHPVTTVLAANGERIHPLSTRLASESAHLEALAGAHELDAFRGMRAMDEILLANFFIFLEAARQTPYDLWIGDEAWEVDHYLHENPELKTARYAWLTDVVGYLPTEPTTADAGEVALAADYNAEMLAQVERFPAVRDLALYIGEWDDLVPDHFGPGLPAIRAWTAAHFEAVGYIRPFDPAALDRARLRERFGFQPGERVAVAAVGGTSVGHGLLRRIIEAEPLIRQRLPDLRLVVVAGPRIDPTALPHRPGIEYHGYVHNLHELLAAADLALVQGGLSTTMELVALEKPFLSFPLQRHFEQQRHVVHRLERYGVPPWARLPFPSATPACIAERLARLLAERPRYQPVEVDGAHRAAQRIAALL